MAKDYSLQPVIFRELPARSILEPKEIFGQMLIWERFNGCVRRDFDDPS